MTLDALIKYAKDKFNSLTIELNNPTLTFDEKKMILKKMIIAERKFRHMLDVPMLCLKRSEMENYDRETSLLLIIIGMLHDIGRIDEILNQDVKNTFKCKVDHSLIGAKVLVKDDNIHDDDHIYEFVSKSLVKDYWQLIRNCVQYHGALNIPNDLFVTKLEKNLINDIRLIDKSSIMNSFLYEDISTVIGIPTSELAKTHISDATYWELTHERQVDRKKANEEYTPNRHFMSHVGFVYDMDDYRLLNDDWVSKYLNLYKPIYDVDQTKKEQIEKSANKRLSKYLK